MLVSGGTLQYWLKGTLQGSGRKGWALFIHLRVSVGSNLRIWHWGTIRAKNPSQILSWLPSAASGQPSRALNTGWKHYKHSTKQPLVAPDSFGGGSEEGILPCILRNRLLEIFFFFFALYLLCEGLLQQPFVVMYRPSNKPVIGFSSSEILPLPQPEPELFPEREGISFPLIA